MRAGAALALGLLATACSLIDGPVAIQTDADPCSVSLLVATDGVLVADPRWGLALREDGDPAAVHTYGVIWPKGYSARRVAGVIELVGRDGSVVAHEGSHVELDAARSDPLTPCSIIHVDAVSGSG